MPWIKPVPAMLRILNDFRIQKDLAGGILLVMVVSVMMASTSIIFSATTREMAMRRFQLASRSFPVWAAQGLIPAMYNFDNRIRIVGNGASLDAAPTDPPYGRASAAADPFVIEETVNHFPARVATFGDFKVLVLSDSDQVGLKMTTTFRNSRLESRWAIGEGDDGVWTVDRLRESWTLDADEGVSGL